MIILKLLFLFILIFLCLSIYWLYTGHKSRREILNNNLEKYYPSIKYNQTERVKAMEVLERFDEKFHYYLLGFESYFKLYPKTWFKKSEDIVIEQKYYKSDFLNIHEKALQIIMKLLYINYTIQCQIEYFEDNIESAEDTMDDIENDKEFLKYYPELYHIRINNLNKFIHHSERIVTHLEEQLVKYESAIDELTNIKKKSLLEKIGVFTWNILSAPVRHIVNLIEGIVFDDSSKIDKSLIMLILGTVGVGLIEEAIEAFEIIDSMETELIDQSSIGIEGYNGNHFIEPHSRTLSDGNVIWVDGDGDTSINRTVEEGGGYLRSNPDGNPHNNLNS